MKQINTEELINSHNSQPDYKLQDLFPFNSTGVGLDGIFASSVDGKFHINNACILTDERTITKDAIYYLAYLKQAENDKSCFVKILDVFYFSNYIYLLIQNILFDHKSLINHRIVNSEQDCQWLLLDINNIDKNLNKVSTLVNKQNTDNELLEFDF